MAQGKPAALDVPAALRRDLAALADQALVARDLIESILDPAAELGRIVEYLATADDPDCGPHFDSYLEASGYRALRSCLQLIYTDLGNSPAAGEGGSLSPYGRQCAEAEVAAYRRRRAEEEAADR